MAQILINGNNAFDLVKNAKKQEDVLLQLLGDPEFDFENFNIDFEYPPSPKVQSINVPPF